MVDAYITLGQESMLNDSDIIDTLADIFSREELERLGFGNFVRDYFDDDEDGVGSYASILENHKFATPERMEEIANNAVDSFGELLNGRSLYDALSGSLKMSDAEILAAGFTTLKEFMEGGAGGDDE